MVNFFAATLLGILATGTLFLLTAALVAFARALYNVVRK